MIGIGRHRRLGQVSMGFAATGALLCFARASGTAGVAEHAGPKPRRNAPTVFNDAAVDTGGWRSRRLPQTPELTHLLTQRGQLSATSSPAERAAALAHWYEVARKRAFHGPDPIAGRALRARELALLANRQGSAFSADELLPPEFLGSPRKTVLGVVVEFAPPGGSDTITRQYPIDPDDPSLGCTTVDHSFGPLAIGDDPPPGPLDNFMFYKPNIAVDDYRSVFFGIGPSAGYGIVRPDLGGIDLTGLSLNNYLLEMSRGTYTTSGDFFDAPVTVPHAHEYYGYATYEEDETGACVPTQVDDAHYNDYIEDVLDAIRDTYDGVVDFSEFDADGDHVVDLLVTIHAGYAWQNGGGEDRLTTSSSRFPVPEQVSGFTTPDDTSDDYFVTGYNVDPEQLDLGGIQEEFEHQFGLPDLYATDLNNSNAWWGAHSAGVWGGPLGGARPVGHNLWQDWVLGWRKPLVIDYDDPRLANGRLRLDVGRARDTPAGTLDGVIVRLPNTDVVVQNLAGSGTGWYSGSGDLLDQRVSRSFDLSHATGTITFSLASAWDIEEDWDYGFVEFSTDGGASWFTLPDAEGLSTDEDPFDLDLVSPGVNWGLTGQGSGRLSYNLSAYAGATLGVRLRYATDPAVAKPGWHVDDLWLGDDTGTLYSNDLETDFSDWTNGGWQATPLAQSFPRYYLLEWRDDNGYDASLQAAYRNAYSSQDVPPPEVVVDRLSYTTPGLVVAVRDTQEEFDYSLDDDLVGGRSIGPKFAHLVVESHPDPLRFDTPDPELGGFVGQNLGGTVLPGDAAFGKTPTAPWSARLELDPVTGDPTEVKSWPSRSAVREFHDSYGYYPGVFAGPDGELYFHDRAASAVLPTRGPYSTRVTDVDGRPLPERYGTTLDGFPLGTGNPGDDLVQFGLHVAVVDSSPGQGTIEIWNRPYEVELSSSTSSGPSGDGSFSLTLSANIGGKLLTPSIVLELPAGVEYVPGSATGGLEPVVPGFATSQAVADGLRRGSVTGPDAAGVRYLVWRGELLPTSAGLPALGFRYHAAPGAAGQVSAHFFKDVNELFQKASIALGAADRGLL